MLSSLFLATAQLFHSVVSLLSLAVLVRVVLSWVRPSPPPGLIRSLIQGLYGVVDPALYAIRRRLPWLVVSGLDLTPVVVILGLQFADTLITGTLLGLA
tara:strand:- start:75 stop:371 length:297 start_codon:yes stop_codon:yes gene_type:complete